MLLSGFRNIDKLKDLPNEQSIRQWSVRLGFNPGLNHTKDLKNGT